MPNAYLVSDLFGDLAPPHSLQYLHDWNRLLTCSGFEVQTIFLNRVAHLDALAESDQDSLQDQLHVAYLHGGLDVAVRGLKAIFEKDTGASLVIAFSLGGYATWLSAASLMPKSRIVYVSTTRLRMTSEPLTHVESMAIFGTNDPNVPTPEHMRAPRITRDFAVISEPSV